MQRIQKAIYWAILTSETSHVFCCVLPTVLSLLSLLAGIGMVTVLPAGLLEFHEIMHRWEVPMIAASGVILLLGWGLNAWSRRLDCHDTGCCHEPCGPKKNHAFKVLVAASILFVFNVTVYALFHAGQDVHFH